MTSNINTILRHIRSRPSSSKDNRPTPDDAHPRVHFSTERQKSSKQTIIHWFRKGLRISDNPALNDALEKIDGYYHELRPVFILNPMDIKQYCGPNRWRFLQQSLQDLDKSLKSIGSRLYVVRGKPEEVLPRLFTEWNVKRLTYEIEVGLYTKARDAEVKALAEKANVQVVEKVSHTLYNPEALYGANGRKLPLSYMEMLDLITRAGVPVLPSPTPIRMPTGCEPFASGIILTSELLDVPDLKEFGLNESQLGPCLFPGGETAGMTRLHNVLSSKMFVCQFEKPLTCPTSIAPSTTALSPYLALGCISPRIFYHSLVEITNGLECTQPPVSLLGQLVWREFYMLLGNYTANFNKMYENDLCIQIPWKNNPEWLQAWAKGETGFPYIDAVMTQLRLEGWIHHMPRHVVACFLTRGYLWVNWEDGEELFQKLQIDYDWCLNIANWMVQSDSALFHNFSFPKKTDPDGLYVRKYIPVLRKVPKEFIYEPWMAPADVLEKAGCILGNNYPRRIVDHDKEIQLNLARMEKALEKNTYRVTTLEKQKGTNVIYVIP